MVAVLQHWSSGSGLVYISEVVAVIGDIRARQCQKHSGNKTRNSRMQSDSR